MYNIVIKVTLRYWDVNNIKSSGKQDNVAIVLIVAIKWYESDHILLSPQTVGLFVNILLCPRPLLLFRECGLVWTLFCGEGLSHVQAPVKLRQQPSDVPKDFHGQNGAMFIFHICTEELRFGTPDAPGPSGRVCTLVAHT